MVPRSRSTSRKVTRKVSRKAKVEAIANACINGVLGSPEELTLFVQRVLHELISGKTDREIERHYSEALRLGSANYFPLLTAVDASEESVPPKAALH